MELTSSPVKDDDDTTYFGKVVDVHEATEGEGIPPRPLTPLLSERAQLQLRRGLLFRYATCLNKAPCLVVFAYLVILGALIPAMWREVEIEKDFSALIRADGEALRYQDSFELASKARKGVRGRRLSDSGSIEIVEDGNELGLRGHPNEFSDWHIGDSKDEANESLDNSIPGLADRRLNSYTYWYRKELEFVYEAESGNALEENVLREVRDFERSLRTLPKWQELCKERGFTERWMWNCDPGESISPFAWPTHLPANEDDDGVSFKLRFDAEGTDLLQFTAMFRYMQDAFARGELSRDPKRYFPEDWDLDAYLDGTGAPPAHIKTKFTFFIGYAEPGWTQEQLRKEMKSISEELADFFETDVWEKIDAEISKEPKGTMKVYYESPAINDLVTQLTLNRDLLYSAGSIAFVSLWMWFQMKSILLSVACFFVVFGSLPLAFVFTPAERTTLAYFSSIFLITIIDIDVIFIFVNFWIQSKGSMESIEERISWTMENAGKSCMATSLTTSVSFFANLASSLQPLREFGLFMGLCVMGVYFLAVLILPPVMILEHRLSMKRQQRWKTHDAQDLGSVEAGFSIVPVDPTIGPTSPAAQLEDAPRRTTSKLVPPLDSKIEERSNHSGASLADAKPIDIKSDATPDIPRDMSKYSLVFDDKKGRQRSRVFVVSPQIERSLTYKFLFYVVDMVSRWACLVLFLTLGMLPLFIFGVWTNLELDLGKPKLFPDDHNQNTAKLMLEKFAKLNEFRPNTAPRAGGDICSVRSFLDKEKMDEKCLFQWCDVDNSLAWTSSTAICHRTQAMVLQEHGTLAPVDSVHSCADVRMVNRFAARGFEANSSHLLDAWRKLLGDATDQRFDTLILGSRKSIVSLAVESWETGGVETQDFYEQFAITPTNTSGLRRCTVHSICFASMPSCTMGPEWITGGSISIPAPNQSERRLLATGRSAPTRLLSDTECSCSDVDVVWGIAAPLSSPMVGKPEWRWRYDSRFEISNPWAQRAIYNTCASSYEANQLFICKRVCWIEKFRTWLLDKKEKRFPTREFDEDVVEWYLNSAPEEDKKQVWFEGGKVVAAQLSFCTKLPKSMSAEGVLDNKKLWDEWLSNLNAQSSETANRAWQFSTRWVSAEANEAIVSSTVLTIILEVAIGYICILFFTGDPILAAIVLSLVVINISGLAFFMIAIYQWTVGPIEVICLVIFVGYSVTFGLHVAGDYARVREDDPDLLINHILSKEMRRYSILTFMRAFNSVDPQGAPLADGQPDHARTSGLTEREKRIGRTRIAVLHVGGAILSAALSSGGTSVFLLMCTLTIFTKIGAVVLTITLLSVFVTLISLPAALITFGPGFHPCYKRWFRALTFRQSLH